MDGVVDIFGVGAVEHFDLIQWHPNPATSIILIAIAHSHPCCEPNY